MREKMKIELQKLKEELQVKQEKFKRSMEIDLNSDYYERNAIADLTVMLELKSQIKTLEYYLKTTPTNVDENISIANNRIEHLIDELIDARKEAIGSGNCPYYSEKRPCGKYGDNCTDCKEKTYENAKEEMMAEYIIG